MLVRLRKFQALYEAVHTQNAVENYVDKINLEATARFRKRAQHARAFGTDPELCNRASVKMPLQFVEANYPQTYPRALVLRSTTTRKPPASRALIP